MAITTELVGTLGGGKVSKIDINFAEPSSNGTYDVVTVPIPSGVPHLVALEMKTIAGNTNSPQLAPRIFFNEVNKGVYSTYFGPGNVVGIFDSAVTIKAQRNSTAPSASAAFTGTVYYCPLGS